MLTQESYEGYKALGFAVVERAVQDYIDGCKYCLRYPKDSKQYATLKENYLSAVDFFLSQRFNQFSDWDGWVVLDYLEKNYGTFIGLQVIVMKFKNDYVKANVFFAEDIYKEVCVYQIKYLCDFDTAQLTVLGYLLFEE